MTDNSNEALLALIHDEMKPLFDRIEREALHMRLYGQFRPAAYARDWVKEHAEHDRASPAGDCRLCGATAAQLDDNLFPACSRRWENVPTRFDHGTWQRVPADAANYRQLEELVTHFSGFMLDTLRSDPADTDLAQIELAAYCNPMRDDGVFVAEKKEIEPYASRGMDGELRYPPAPRTPHKFPQQLPHDFARRVIACWNACRGLKTEDLENGEVSVPERGFGT